MKRADFVCSCVSCGLFELRVAGLVIVGGRGRCPGLDEVAKSLLPRSGNFCRPASSPRKEHKMAARLLFAALSAAGPAVLDLLQCFALPPPPRSFSRVGEATWRVGVGHLQSQKRTFAKQIHHYAVEQTQTTDSNSKENRKQGGFRDSIFVEKVGEQNFSSKKI